jgi:hypothetical protein
MKSPLGASVSARASGRELKVIDIVMYADVWHASTMHLSGHASLNEWRNARQRAGWIQTRVEQRIEEADQT